MIPLIIVEGPTASGKTELAARIAEKYGGEVVSADSMQVYKYMDIGSAKPTRDEMRGVAHHMIDVVMPTQNFSLFDYVGMAHEIIKDIHKRGKLPVMAGGTGLYIDTVKNNVILSDEEKDSEIRSRLQQKLNEYGAEYLHDILKSVDPDSAAKIHPNNSKRVIRAIEVYETTGKPMSRVQEQSRSGEKIYNTLELGIWYERETLYERIDRRVDIMMEMGLEAEVQKCVELGCTRANTSMQAIGYKEILDYFDGLCTLSDATDKIKQESRRYAKRQITWFKRSNINWFRPGCSEDDIDKAVRSIVD